MVIEIVIFTYLIPREGDLEHKNDCFGFETPLFSDMVAILYESRVTAAGQDSTYDSSAIVNIPAWIFFFICPFIVGMRIWVRKRTGVGLGADDYTILIALVSTLEAHA